MEVGGWFNGLNAVLPDDCRVMDGMGSSSTCLICEEVVVVGVYELFAGALELAWCGEGRFMNLMKLCLDTGSYESAVP